MSVLLTYDRLADAPETDLEYKKVILSPGPRPLGELTSSFSMVMDWTLNAIMISKFNFGIYVEKKIQ